MHPRWLIILASFALFAGTNLVSAQSGSTISLKNEKPSDYAKKTLRAEKTGYGNLGKFQELMQNTFTHFNYLFNANNKLQKIMTEAVASYQEDYDRLLSFYPYDEKTFSKNAFLDSVIQHATAGLLLHDLRNTYVDELYFLIGKAYFYEQKYDTAHQIFQYLNYAFAPKDDGYDLPIGSNISKTPGVFTILNPEKKHFIAKGYQVKQRRNDGLVWQIRNYIQMDDYVQAAALLEYIQKDIQLPTRLIPLLYETRAYFFYQQKKYDSAAINLEKTHYTLYKQGEKPRAYFLTAQLYMLAGDTSSALNYFRLAKSRAANPLMSIYAALQEASLQKDSLAAKDQTHLLLLKKLSKKEKYARYKDVIYFAQAKILSDRGELDNAQKYLLESIQLNEKIQPPNPAQKSASYVALANINYDQGRFYAAAHNYDSVSVTYLKDTLDSKLVRTRQTPLHLFKDQTDSINRQDSLLQLALLPEKERYQILKEKAKTIRKTISKKEQLDDNAPVNPAILNQTTTELFPTTEATGVAWYFNNPTLKNTGLNLFRQKFGNRPNVDNWQRISAITGMAKPGISNKVDEGLLTSFNPDGSLKVDSANITPEDLLKDLPMTAEAKTDAYKKMSEFQFKNGQVLQNSLENFTGAIAAYDSLILQYPKSERIAEAIFNQYVCWILLGNKEKANLVKAQLSDRFANSKWNKLLQQGAQQSLKPSPSSLQDTGTKIYNDIYQLFIEGDFAQAYAKKAIADKQYGDYYWTPQLLYIEAVYNITERKDSIAIDRLNYLIGRFGSSPIKAQAAHLLQVLKRRKEIEDYLSKLKITPNDYLGNNRLAQLENATRALDNLRERRIALLKHQQIMSTADSTAVLEQLATNVTNSNRELTLKKPPVTTTEPSADSAQKQIPPQPDTTVSIPAPQVPENKPDIAEPSSDSLSTAQPPPAAQDSTLLAQQTPVTPEQTNQPRAADQQQALKTKVINGYTINPASAHYVAIVLHKVAPVFASEATNAFNRYNLLAFEHEKFTVTGQKSGDYDLILIGPFDNMDKADAFQQLIKPATAGTILPWLTPEKYNFILISPENEHKLKSTEDITNYLEAWRQFQAK